MSKKQQAVTSVVRLIVGAGQASPTPPVGPALGQRGVKAIDFCKQFNDQTKEFTPGVPMRVQITVKPDRTFSFLVRPPNTSYLLKKAASVEKCATQPGKESCATVSLKHVYEIAKIKHEDASMKQLPLRSLCSQVISIAKSMGIQVVP